MELTILDKGRRLVGSENISVSQGEWVQFRTGVVGNITEHIQEQCPQGKAWSVLITIRIDEVDA